MPTENYDADLIEQMYQSGLPLADMQAITGLSESQLNTVFEKMGLTRSRIKRPTPEQQAQIIALHRQGLNHRQIARQVGFSDVTVSRIID